MSLHVIVIQIPKPENKRKLVLQSNKGALSLTEPQPYLAAIQVLPSIPFTKHRSYKILTLYILQL